MKVALIPPTSLLYMVADQPLHMVIPEGLRSKVYTDFYRALGLSDGRAIMLDNGAFEAEGAEFTSSHEQLFSMTYAVDADIVVLPDKMGDGPATYAKSRNYMHFWELHHATQLEAAKPVQFMGVVQGQDMIQLERSIQSFMDIEEEFETTLILGLPRWLSEINVQIRIRLAEYINERAPHPIHLLGMIRGWMGEVEAAAKIPSIISMDTAAPFVYAYHDKVIGVDPIAERPQNYFECRINDLDLVKRNIDTLWSWANA